MPTFRYFFGKFRFFRKIQTSRYKGTLFQKIQGHSFKKFRPAGIKGELLRKLRLVAIKGEPLSENSDQLVLKGNSSKSCLVRLQRGARQQPAHGIMPDEPREAGMEN